MTALPLPYGAASLHRKEEARAQEPWAVCTGFLQTEGHTVVMLRVSAILPLTAHIPLLRPFFPYTTCSEERSTICIVLRSVRN